MQLNDTIRRNIWIFLMKNDMAKCKIICSFILIYMVQDCASFSSNQISVMGQTPFEKAAVVTNSLACTGIALDMLSDGGSAVDAAIAAAFCEGVTNPQSMGIGGGFIATIYDNSKSESTVLNAREVAPQAASKHMFGNIPPEKGGITSGLTIAVPGEILGYYEMHSKYGKIPWINLAIPTIALCRHGILVTTYTGSIIANFEKKILSNPTLRKELTNTETGRLYQPGELMKRLTLANTLELVSSKGPEVLYNGDLTVKFVEDIRNNGGIITADDLKKYKPRWQESIKQTIEGYVVHSAPLPASGSLLVLILETLSKVIAQGNPVIIWHRILEIWKYTYAIKSNLTSPYFYPNETVVKLEAPFKTNMSDMIKSLLNDNTTSNNTEDYFNVYKDNKDHGTGHISILAPNGDAVALTSTINTGFGSMFVSQSTGIILNNEMIDFTIPELNPLANNPNAYIAPYKQPLSSMCPTIITDVKTKRVLLIIGGSGGLKILTATSLVIIRYIWFNDSLARAIFSERLHHQLIPMIVEYEHGFPVDIIKGLQEKGHGFRLLLRPQNGAEGKMEVSGSVNGISVKVDGIFAVADPRRGAVGAGF